MIQSVEEIKKRLEAGESTDSVMRDQTIDEISRARWCLGANSLLHEDNHLSKKAKINAAVIGVLSSDGKSWETVGRTEGTTLNTASLLLLLAEGSPGLLESLITMLLDRHSDTLAKVVARTMIHDHNQT